MLFHLQLADLKKVLAAAQAGKGGRNGRGQGAGEGDGEGESGAGKGGVGRGPGYAALNLTEDAGGLAETSLALPPGAAAPEQWVPIDERLTTPDVAPQTNTAAGSAGAEGRGGAAWQMQLAPRHRAVGQRFFEAGATAGASGPR